MSTHTARPAVDLAPDARPKPALALALALLSAAGIMFGWDLSPAVGFAATGAAIAAIVVGLKARSRLAGAKGTRTATAAVVIGSLGVLTVVTWTAVESLG